MYTQEEITNAYGPFVPAELADRRSMKEYIKEIHEFPAVLESFVNKLNPEYFDACYRDGGWTFRQVIHHVADSHMQAFSRFKLALTEDTPVIKPYIQNSWAETADSLATDPIISVQLLKALHARWVILLESLSDTDFEKSYIHPEYNKEYKLFNVLGLYAWHGKHHYAQMARYAANQGWMGTVES